MESEFCYMCSKEKTSAEHVPPKCLFPESKDIQGIDLRRELITVPSCEIHNFKKSKDDEFLLYILSMNLPTNEIAQIQFKKVERSIERSIKRPNSLIRTMMTNVSRVTVVNSETREAFPTIAIRNDDSRLESALDHIGRGLYFYHFKERWPGNVITLPEFILPWPIPDIDQGKTDTRTEVIKMASNKLAECEFHGANPSVFKYQVQDIEGDKLMRLHFYGDCRVTMYFCAISLN